MGTIRKKTKLGIREVNRHLVCRLCRGYYIDATAIKECLHSFCRSCILKYLDKNSFCPICEVQVHKAKPHLSLRLDKTLQDIVYKLVPGLYQQEMERRREFYKKNPQLTHLASREELGFEDRLIFSPTESFSISLEYLDSYEDLESVSSTSSESGGDLHQDISFPQQLGLMMIRKSRESQESDSGKSIVNDQQILPVRYLSCPAMFNILHLKKFIRMKYDLSLKWEVDIIHKRVSLPDHYTLMDVAYIYTWKRNAPLRFLYQINRHIPVLPGPSPVEEPKTETKPNEKTESSIKPSKINDNTKLSDKTKDLVIKTSETQQNSVQVSEEGKVEQNKINNVGKTNDKVKSVDSCKPSVANKNSDLKPVEKPSEVKKNSVQVYGSQVGGRDAKSNIKSKSPENKTNVTPKPVCNGNQKIAITGKKETKTPVATKVAENIKINEEVKNNVIKDKETPVTLKTKVGESKGEGMKVTNGQKVETSKSREHLEEKDTEMLLNPYSGQLEPSDSRAKVECSLIRTSVGVEKRYALSTQLPETKKSNVNLLKTFRKDKNMLKDVKPGKSLTITPIAKRDKSIEEASVSIEIKSEAGSEYDFDSSSPPTKIMSLQEYTKSESYRSKYAKNGTSPDNNKTPMPSLYRINSDTHNKRISELKVRSDIEKSRMEIKAAAEGKPQTPSKQETQRPTKALTPSKQENPRPIKPLTPSKQNGESLKREASEKLPGTEPKMPKLEGKTDSNGICSNDNILKALLKKRKDSGGQGNEAKKQKTEEQRNIAEKITPPTPIDLSKNEKMKNPLENLIEMASKGGDPRNHQNMIELLISVAQKQSIEPLLKIPQPQTSSNTSPGSSSSPTEPKNTVTPTAISQALQFFQKLSSEMKQLEAKSNLNNGEHKLPPKPINVVSLQQFYQQQVDLIRMLKKQQHLKTEQARHPTEPKMNKPEMYFDDKTKQKLSPNKEDCPQTAHLKSSLEKTLSQIHEQAEYQSRLLAAQQNYKNIPNILQYYQSQQAMLRPPASHKVSPKPSQKTKSSPKSPNDKNPLPSPVSDHLINSNYFFNQSLSPDMSFHQMFQQYLDQQDKINQSRNLANKTKSSNVPEAVVPSTVSGTTKPDVSVIPVQKT